MSIYKPTKPDKKELIREGLKDLNPYVRESAKKLLGKEEKRGPA